MKWLALGGGVLVLIRCSRSLPDHQRGLDGLRQVRARVHRPSAWIPAENEFGAWTFIYGTLVTGFGSVILATLLGVAIGLFLALMAPSGSPR